MIAGDWINVAAVLLSPLIAILVTRWRDDQKEVRQRKQWVFYTLMATRAARVSAEHVRALNSIDIEFVKNKEVTRAWKALLDHLNTPQESPEAWVAKSEDLFIDMLHEMSKVMKFDFDKTHLKRAIYSPRAHGDIEADTLVIRKALVALAKGEQPLRVAFNEPPASEADTAAAALERQAWRDVITGTRPLRITIDNPAAPSPSPEQTRPGTPHDQ